MIVTGISGNIRNVLVGFAGDIEPILSKQLGARPEAKFILLQASNDVNQKRHPARRRFDETKAQRRKLLGNFVGNNVAKGEQRHHPGMAEGMVASQFEHFEDCPDTAAGMNANRKVLLLSFLVNGEKIGIVERVIALDAAKENSHGAVLLGKANLVDGVSHRLQRQHGDPFDSIGSLSAGMGKKTIVGAAKRDL